MSKPRLLVRRTPEEMLAYYNGVRAGLRMYAWEEKDGTKYVGNPDVGNCTMLARAMELVDTAKELADNFDDLFDEGRNLP